MGKPVTSTKHVRSSRSMLKTTRESEVFFEKYSPTAELADKEFLSKLILECLIDNDVEGVIDAIRTFIDARNKLHLSKSQNIPRSTIYEALKPGANPTVKTLAKLLHATANS